MRKYVHETINRWERFQRNEAVTAAEIKNLILAICGNLASTQRKKEIASSLASSEAVRLREIAMRHAPELGIRENTDQELALWIRTVCFCEVMRQERLE